MTHRETSSFIRISENVIYDAALLKNIEDINTIEERLPNSYTNSTRYKEKTNLELRNQINLTLGSVYFTPKLSSNFMSCHCLDQSGITRSFAVKFVNNTVRLKEIGFCVRYQRRQETVYSCEIT